MGLVGAGLGALLGARGGLISSIAGSILGSYAEDRIRGKVSKSNGSERKSFPKSPSDRDSGNDPYTVLGCSRSDSDEVVRTAYLTKVRRLHPDALEAKDVPSELMSLANAEMARVNTAWEEVKAERKSLR